MPEPVVLDATLRPSRLLATWIIVWGMLVAIPLWFSAMLWWLCVVIDVVIFGWLLLALRRHYYGVGARQLRYQNGHWTLVTNNRRLEVELDGEFYLSRWLIVLVLRLAAGKKEVLVIAPDSIDPDDMRRLWVILKQLPVPETVT